MIYETYIRPGITPEKCVGIEINKAKLQSEKVENYEVALPDNMVILARKNDPVLNKIDSWVCEEGILIPRYIHWCLMIIIGQGLKDKIKVNWAENTMLIKSMTYNSALSARSTSSPHWTLGGVIVGLISAGESGSCLR